MLVMQVLVKLVQTHVCLETARCRVPSTPAVVHQDITRLWTPTTISYVLWVSFIETLEENH